MARVQDFDVSQTEFMHLAYSDMRIEDKKKPAYLLGYTNARNA
jgi:hypothetical protein